MGPCEAATFGHAKLLRQRARLLSSVRSWFTVRDFLEVETPILVPSPGLDVHLDAFEAVPKGATPRYLITSPEYQMKRLLAGGLPRIFQIVRCFRRDEVGALHNPEFTMLEWYRAPAEVEDVMRDTEGLVGYVTGGEVRLGARRIETRPPFARISVCEAMRSFAGVDEATVLAWSVSDEDRFFRTWVTDVEPALERLDHAVFVTDYPLAHASLARPNPRDPRFAERFELYVAGVELCNGFGELTDSVVQRARFEKDREVRAARGLDAYPIDERFLSALPMLPPCSGNALGLDRLIALACGTTRIGDVIAFTEDEL